MQGYLVYVYRHKLKVVECYIGGGTARPVHPTSKHKYYTKVPRKEFEMYYGKLWCADRGKIERCKNILKMHYKKTGRLLVDE